jgi:hypothetical protein
MRSMMSIRRAVQAHFVFTGQARIFRTWAVGQGLDWRRWCGLLRLHHGSIRSEQRSAAHAWTSAADGESVKLITATYGLISRCSGPALSPWSRAA